MEGILIQFFVDGQPYALRRWRSVPRRGDEVMLRDSATGAKVPFEVTRVVWGVEPLDESKWVDRLQTDVNIDLKRIE
jgi:hypothetical protein